MSILFYIEMYDRARTEKMWVNSRNARKKVKWKYVSCDRYWYLYEYVVVVVFFKFNKENYKIKDSSIYLSFYLPIYLFIYLSNKVWINPEKNRDLNCNNNSQGPLEENI